MSEHTFVFTVSQLPSVSLEVISAATLPVCLVRLESGSILWIGSSAMPEMRNAKDYFWLGIMLFVRD